MYYFSEAYPQIITIWIAYKTSWNISRHADTMLFEYEVTCTFWNDNSYSVHWEQVTELPPYRCLPPVATDTPTSVHTHVLMRLSTMSCFRETTLMNWTYTQKPVNAECCPAKSDVVWIHVNDTSFVKLFVSLLLNISSLCFKCAEKHISICHLVF